MTRYKLDLDALDNYTGSSMSAISFDHCSNNSGVKDEYQFNGFSIFFLDSTGYTISLTTTDSHLYTFDQTTINTILSDVTDRIIYFDADLSFASVESKVLTLINLGIISVNQNGNTTLFVYKQNSENDALDKTLTDVNIFDGKFNHAIGLKNIDVDLVGYNFDFNYVYIPLLSRYYYVDSIELISGNVTRLHLKEDVLMSWKTLIKNQHMLITRWESSEETYITDDRLPLESRFKTRYEDLSDTTTGALSKITLLTNPNPNDLNILVTTITSPTPIQNPQSLGAGSIDSTNLPQISPRRTADKHYYLLNYNQLGNFLSACAQDSASASFIISCIWLPFIPLNYWGFSERTNYDSPRVDKGLGAGTKQLTIQHSFESDNSYTYVQVKELQNGICPYLIYADFKFPDVESFRNYQPYMKMDIFIAYVGWVSVSMSDIIDDSTGVRAIIYYAMDFETGKASAYLWDYTRKKMIWSGNCQLGVIIDINTSDMKQNRIARELLAMNTIQMAGKSAIDIGGGYASGNYGKMAGGILNLGMGLAKYPLQDMAIMDHMNGTFTGSDNSLYAPTKPCLRITYRKRIDQTDWVNYNKLYGKPYNKFVNGTTITGYVEIGDIHFNPKNEKIYQDEIDEIIGLLKNGVIF